MEQETKSQSREEPLPAPSKKRSWLIVKLAVVLIVVITAFLLPDYVTTKTYDGLYRYSIPGVEIFFEVDLRKDGTARILQFPEDGFMPLGGTASLCTWKVSGDKIILENRDPVNRGSKSDYQSYQAMLALGSGGSTGLGLGNGGQKLGFHPGHDAAITDTIIREEMGELAGDLAKALKPKPPITHKYIFEIEGKDIFAFKAMVLDEEGGWAEEEKIKTRQKVRLLRQ